MVVDVLFGKTNQLVGKAMELRWAKQGLLASNIANAETPGYRAVDIDFKATMEQLISKTQETPNSEMNLHRSDPRHFQNPGIEDSNKTPKIIFAAGDADSFGNDSNSVEIEQQLARSQMNATLYTMLSRIMAKKTSGMRTTLDNLGRL